MNINEFPQQVNQVISIAETILQGQILGIYLYGSATMNGLRPDTLQHLHHRHNRAIATLRKNDVAYLFFEFLVSHC